MNSASNASIASKVQTDQYPRLEADPPTDRLHYQDTTRRQASIRGAGARRQGGGRGLGIEMEANQAATHLIQDAHSFSRRAINSRAHEQGLLCSMRLK